MTPTRRISGNHAWIYASAIFLSFAFGCSRSQDSKVVDLKTFPLKGQVVSIDREKKRIMIAHQEIPNFMMAMTMPFKVKDTTLLNVAQPGDSVQGILAVSRTESWIETLSLLGQGEPSQPAAENAIFKRLLKEGELLPDVMFTNQDGKKLRLSDQRGNVVALTFIYTRCPLPDFCIRMSNYFGSVQKELRNDAALKGRWHLLSVSFDPKFDSPKVLKNYGTSYGADFSTWDFVTTSQQALDHLAESLDLYVQPGEGGLIDHTLRTIVIDRNGRLVKVFKGNDWTPDDLLKVMRSEMMKQPS